MREMFIIVGEVFGDQLQSRVVRVAGTQIANNGVTHAILAGGNEVYCDVLSGAPYFNRTTYYGSTDALLEGLANHIVRYRDDVFPNFVALSEQYGLRPTCYEAGLDLWDVSDEERLAVRRDPRIGDLYNDYYSAWKNAGGTLMVHYTFCDQGWGLLEHMEQPVSEAYQYMETLDFITNNPMWWEEPARIPATGVIDNHHGAHTAGEHAMVRFSQSEHAITFMVPDMQKSATVQVYSLSGRSSKVVVAVVSQSRSVSVSTRGLAAGHYIAQFAAAGINYTRPFSIQQ
jgi:hypothetical protein